jgi:predicted small secreted protein
MKKVLRMTAVSLLATALGLIVACSTIHGVGKDISKGGQAISHAAH